MRKTNRKRKKACAVNVPISYKGNKSEKAKQTTRDLVKYHFLIEVMKVLQRCRVLKTLSIFVSVPYKGNERCF